VARRRRASSSSKSGGIVAECVAIRQAR
jgi:hypothetical protein